ncbi:MAG TPA: PKD domain-containing protein, partial [bacterium (Candidatus Stahlbacteria)]|nr:PKD domain-containing protein [Candidatus Stahlbacteria bacterium]
GDGNEDLYSSPIAWTVTVTEPPDVVVTDIDIYTNKGGIGKNNEGGIYSDGELVHFYVALTKNGEPLSGAEVYFDGGYCADESCSAVIDGTFLSIPISKETDKMGKIEIKLRLFSKKSGKFVLLASHKIGEDRFVVDKVYVNIRLIQEWEDPYDYTYITSKSLYTNNLPLIGSLNIAECEFTGSEPPHGISLKIVSNFLAYGNATSTGGYLIISDPWKPNVEGKQLIRIEGEVYYNLELRSGEGLGFTKSFATGVVLAKLIDVTEGKVVAEKNKTIFLGVNPSRASMEGLLTSLIQPGAVKLTEDITKSVANSIVETSKLPENAKVSQKLVEKLAPKITKVSPKLVKGAGIVLTVVNIGTIFYEYFHPVKELDEYPFILTLDAELNKSHEYIWSVLYLSSSGAESIGFATAQSFVWSVCTIKDIRVILSNINTTPPTINKIEGPTPITQENKVKLTWSGSDNEAKSSDLEYSYKLIGYDEDWSEWTRKNTVYYEELPEGNYTFKVKARDQLGNIGMPALLHFSIIQERKYDVYLIPSLLQKTTTPNLNATYILTAINTGTVTDSYALLIENMDNVAIASLNKSSITNLPPGSSSTILLNVTDVTPGTYNVSVTVKSLGDSTKSDFVIIKTIVQAKIPPIALFTYSLPAEVDKEITFDASFSYDPDGYITNYKWDFGDGNITTTTLETITHSYSSVGDYYVTLTVTDDDGATNSATKVITVSAAPNQLPIANFTYSPLNPVVNQQVTFDASPSYDP